MSILTIKAEANYKNSLTELVTVRQLYNLEKYLLDLLINIKYMVPDKGIFNFFFLIFGNLF